jgi:hypothetical protein
MLKKNHTIYKRKINNIKRKDNTNYIKNEKFLIEHLIYHLRLLINHINIKLFLIRLTDLQLKPSVFLVLFSLICYSLFSTHSSNDQIMLLMHFIYPPNLLSISDVDSMVQVFQLTAKRMLATIVHIIFFMIFFLLK